MTDESKQNPHVSNQKPLKEKKKAGEKLKKELEAEFPNLWDQADKQTKNKAMSFAEEYRRFLDLGKTERTFVQVAVETLEEQGFIPLESQVRLEPGQKVYQVVRNKGIVAAVVGQDEPDEGFNIIGAHIDSPRLDLKPIPLYEEKELVYMKTHYYGGIKKYQWTAIPLAIHGVVFCSDGSSKTISIGENPDEPVLTITDLLPHLSSEQMNRKGKDLIRGEELNVLTGSIPYPDSELSGRFKLAVLQLLNERYGIIEKDLVSAEIELVPAGTARDVGLDSSLLGAYGQDDRVCAYTALAALAECEKPRRTVACLLFDKEEIGSEGNTGARSRSYENILQELYVRCSTKNQHQIDFSRMLNRCQMLSADVSAAFDPQYASVYDSKNSCYLGHGLCLVKYVGSRGKYGTSDANAEFFNRLARLFDDEKVPWQTGELGKVDEGGGGTVAVYLASLGMEVIDCGVPVLSMHSPFEITSKIDIYYTYQAYQTFLTKA